MSKTKRKIAVSKRGSVWMVEGRAHQSAARELAEMAMRGARLDTQDFRVRDEIIVTISPTLEGMLNHVATLNTKAANERTCVHCGCTDSRACASGCRWIQKHEATPTGVCSQCAAKQCQAVVIGKIFVGRNGPDTFWLEVAGQDPHRGEGLSIKEKRLARLIEGFFVREF